MTTLSSPIRRKRPWLKNTVLGSLVLIGVTLAATKLSLAIREARNAAFRAVTT